MKDTHSLQTTVRKRKLKLVPTHQTRQLLYENYAEYIRLSFVFAIFMWYFNANIY